MNDVIIIAASYYTRRVFFEPSFEGLPPQVKKELIAAAGLAAEKARGILTVSLRGGEVAVGVEREGDDFDFDEIRAKEAVHLFMENQSGNLGGVALWAKAKGYAL